jgi:hypothetical protein
MLLTGRGPLYLTAGLARNGDWFESEVSSEPSWEPDEKIVAEELGPYLASLDAGPVRASSAA